MGKFQGLARIRTGSGLKPILAIC